jgi:starch-binding outer membrane protein, SusD/RagB family
MKKIYLNIILILMGGSILLSCNDDFLDRHPIVQPSEETYWNTEAEAERALLACYRTLKEPIFSAGRSQSGVGLLYWEALSDNAHNTSNWEGFDIVMRGDFHPGSNLGVINKYWQFPYQGINSCNYFLKNVDRVQSVSENTNKRMKAEASFLRAFYYSILIQLYGDVPLILEPASMNSGFMEMPRTGKEAVLNQILSDLDFAIANLPSTGYSNGRAVKGSAVTLKTRVLLYNHKYQQAAETAWSLIGDPQNPYQLHNSYSGIFFGQQSNNKEIMFSVLFKAPDDYHSLDQVLGGRMSIFPTTELRDVYELNDPRRKMTIFEEGDPWAYNPNGFGKPGSTSEGQIPFTKMAIKKYVNPIINNASGATMSDQHIVMSRYADLLLMYAESVVEWVGSTEAHKTQALTALNMVRSRPGVNMPERDVLTRDYVRYERRVELAFEGFRYQDLIRWGTAHEVLPTLAHNSGGAKRKFKAYLFPIPLSQMDIMTHWEQNPGY